MNTDITASTKPEYPVIDRNPPFTKVVGNFDTLDYLRFVTITGVSVTVGYLSGIKPGIRGPSMVTGGLIGLMGGFMYAYQNSAGRLMGFFPNEGEIADDSRSRLLHIEARRWCPVPVSVPSASSLTPGITCWEGSLPLSPKSFSMDRKLWSSGARRSASPADWFAKR